MQVPPDKKGDLIPVPAIHYHSIFAAHVNAICRDEARRPDAISVELGASAVQAIIAWLKELGVDSGKRLPVMLGLTWRNRHIHPKYRETAIRLQREYGKPLHMIPKEVLHEYMNYTDGTILCLSPTDSIIEAIRCGIELDIPVHGVDLEEMAPHEPVRNIIEEPLMARKDIEAYVQRNMALAADSRDPYVDGRREKVMSARIKYLLERHHRVLFTCGLGHWARIQRLLEDSSAPAANALPQPGATKMKRILVKPSTAIRQMDIYPSVTTYYEKQRFPAGNADTAPANIDYVAILREQLDTAYAKYLSNKKNTPRGKNNSSLLGLHRFEDFLMRYCAVNHTLMPDAHLLLTAAESVMPDRFRKVLERSLLSRKIKWATSKQFPELPVLTTAPFPPSDSTPPGPGTISFFITNVHPELSSRNSKGNRLILIPPASNDEPRPRSRNRSNDRIDTPWVWPPCEYIFYSTALDAAEKLNIEHAKHKSQAFEGALLGGLDIRSSLRAAIRDDNTLYVKQLPRHMEYVVAGGHAIEPTVFVFENPDHPLKGRWSLGTAGYPLREYVEPDELSRFDHITRTRGSVFVSWVNVALDAAVPAHLQSVISSAKRLNGALLFGNPTANLKQSARWLKETRYSTCPILDDSGVQSLFRHYQSSFGIDPKNRDLNHASALVMMAVPYAHKRIMVIGPDNFEMDASVQKEAKARGISIDFLPLTSFPDTHISKMRLQYILKRGSNPINIPPMAEKILGSQDEYRHKLPPAMQQQGR